MSGRASSPDGAVRVVTDTGGVPTELTLTRSALRLGEQALAEEVFARCTEAAAAAREDAAARLRARGASRRTLRSLGLPQDPPAREEPTGEPTSWLRPW